MNLKSDERGFALVEFAMALPLLILLLYALGTILLKAAQISREQVADYALETEAQEIIDRITTDARVAYAVEINHATLNSEEIVFICHSNHVEKHDPPDTFNDCLSLRRYTVHSSQRTNRDCIYLKRAPKDIDPTYNNPITGENSFAITAVQELKFSKPSNASEAENKILHITLKMQNIINKQPHQSIQLSTEVFMPACERITYHGRQIYPEEVPNE